MPWPSSLRGTSFQRGLRGPPVWPAVAPARLDMHGAKPFGAHTHHHLPEATYLLGRRLWHMDEAQAQLAQPFIQHHMRWCPPLVAMVSWPGRFAPIAAWPRRWSAGCRWAPPCQTSLR